MNKAGLAFGDIGDDIAGAEGLRRLGDAGEREAVEGVVMRGRLQAERNPSG